MTSQIPFASEAESFRQFLNDQLDAGCSQDLAPETLVAAWRAQHPSPTELEESLVAINRAISQMAAGEKGRSARTLIAEARHRLTSGSDEI